jgi:hypothetical protein
MHGCGARLSARIESWRRVRGKPPSPLTCDIPFRKRSPALHCEICKNEANSFRFVKFLFISFSDTYKRPRAAANSQPEKMRAARIRPAVRTVAAGGCLKSEDRAPSPALR